MKRSIVVNNNVLREARNKMGLSQEDIANSLGVTRKTYIKYEKERTYLSKDAILKISSLLNADYDALVLLDIEKEIERIENYPIDKLKERLHL